MADVVRKWSWVRIQAPSSPECDLTLNLLSACWTLAQESDSQRLIYSLSVLEGVSCPTCAYTEITPALKGIEIIKSSSSTSNSSSNSSRSRRRRRRSSSNKILRTPELMDDWEESSGLTFQNQLRITPQCPGKDRHFHTTNPQLMLLSGHCHQPQSQLGCASHHCLFPQGAHFSFKAHYLYISLVEDNSPQAWRAGKYSTEWFRDGTDEAKTTQMWEGCISPQEDLQGSMGRASVTSSKSKISSFPCRLKTSFSK